MNFTGRFRNLIVAATLAATVAPLAGCAVGTADDVDAVEEVGATEQALDIGPGQVFSALNAAKELYTKVDVYQRTGKLLALVDIYEQVAAVDTKVDALRIQLDNMKAEMMEVATDEAITDANDWMIDIDAAMRGWVAAQNDEKAGNANAMKDFYAQVRAGDLGIYGEFDMTVVEKLANHATSAITLYGKSLQEKTGAEAMASANNLGVYAVAVRLRITEGFLLISLAMQDKGAPEFAAQTGSEFVRHQDLLATFDTNFFDANDAMNKAIVEAEMAWRGTMIEQCNEGTDDTIYFKDWGPGTSEFPYNARISCVTRPGGWMAGTTCNEDALMRSCGTFRSSYVAQQKALWGSQKMRELLAAETAFTNRSTASDAAPTIFVGEALYGSLSVTAHAQSGCNNRGTCDFAVNVSELGDIAPGVTKSFTLTYICGNDSTSKKVLTIPAEANGKTVTLSCE